MAPSAAELEVLLLNHLALLQKIVAIECRQGRVSDADRSDFASYVNLKLIEDDYAVLRAFEGRCSLQTYLSVVVHRLRIDFVTHQLGKWRPSAQASKLGPAGIRIDSLLNRDRLGPEEAWMTYSSSDSSMTRDAFDRIAAEIPLRTRRQHVDLVHAETEVPVQSETVERGAEEGLRSEIRRKTTEAVRDALEEMGPEERLLIRLRFDAGMTLADIARSLVTPQKPLYRRFRRIFDRLKELLASRGIDEPQLNQVIGRSETDFDFGLATLGNLEARPSMELESNNATDRQVTR